MGLALSDMDLGVSSPKKRPVSLAKPPYDEPASTESGGDMKKSATFVLSLVMALYGYSAAAQGQPTQTGLDHAETTANANGQRGIENAEAKQARVKGGKKLAKGKFKEHHHGHAFAHKK